MERDFQQVAASASCNRLSPVLHHSVTFGNLKRELADFILQTAPADIAVLNAVVLCFGRGLKTTSPRVFIRIASDGSDFSVSLTC